MAANNYSASSKKRKIDETSLIWWNRCVQTKESLDWESVKEKYEHVTKIFLANRVGEMEKANTEFTRNKLATKIKQLRQEL